MPEANLQARAVSKRYGTQRVLDQLDLSLSPGQTVCLLGPNGAGKTTLLRVLAGLLRPTAGELRLDGAPLDFTHSAARRQFGLVMHQTYLYEQLSGPENLRFYANLYQVDLSEGSLQALLRRVGLNPTRPTPVRAYSRGMKQRLTIARALLPSPRILLLDEPYTGLDMQGCQLLNDLLRHEREEGRIILATTHELSYVLQVATHFAVLARGRIAELFPNDEFSLDALQSRYQQLAQPVKAEARP